MTAAGKRRRARPLNRERECDILLFSVRFPGKKRCSLSVLLAGNRVFFLKIYIYKRLRYPTVILWLYKSKPLCYNNVSDC